MTHTSLTRETLKLISQPYDSFLACELYLKSRPTAFEFMAPLVRLVWRRDFSRLSGSELDECILNSLGHLVWHIAARRYQHPDFDDDHFTYYYYASIKRQFLNTLKACRTFTYLPPKATPYHARLLHPHDIENRIYLQQIPGYLKIVIMNQVRYDDNEYRACEYVLDKILAGEPPIMNHLKRNLRIDVPDFFVSYMTVLLRATLTDMRLEGRRNYFSDVTHDFGYAIEDRDQHS